MFSRGGRERVHWEQNGLKLKSSQCFKYFFRRDILARIRGELHIDFRTQCVIMKQIT